MASNRKPVQRKTAANSDPLTGEWLRPDTLRLVVRDYDLTRREHPKRNIPYRLHRRAVEGRLGGHALSPEAERYWRGSLGSRPEPTYTQTFWWSPAWAERELRAFFPADCVDIVLAVRRDHQAWDMAMIGSERALGEVKAIMRQMRNHCQKMIDSEAAWAA